MVLVIYYPWELGKIFTPIIFFVLLFRGETLVEKGCPLGRYTEDMKIHRRHEECHNNIVCMREKSKTT